MGKHSCPHTDRPIFSRGRCKQCAAREDYKPLKRTHIRKNAVNIAKANPKRAKLLQFYNQQASKFKLQHPQCAAKIQNCNSFTSDVHHKRGKENSLLIASAYFLPVCRNCHDWIGAHTQESIELGFSLARNSKTVTVFTEEELLFLETNNIKHG